METFLRKKVSAITRNSINFSKTHRITKISDCIEAVWFKCLFSTSIQSNEVVKSVLYKLEMQQLPQKY